MQYWIIKSEPVKYSLDQMKQDKTTFWDGVRNYEARNNLRAMKKGDICFFYHSNTDKAIVGCVEVVKEAYPDPTIDDDTWVVVDVKYKKAAKQVLTLEAMKLHKELQYLAMVKKSRISVTPVTEAEAAIIKDLTGL